jgi:hypothetical protein
MDADQAAGMRHFLYEPSRRDEQQNHRRDNNGVPNRAGKGIGRGGHGGKDKRDSGIPA